MFYCISFLGLMLCLSLGGSAIALLCGASWSQIRKFFQAVGHGIRKVFDFVRRLVKFILKHWIVTGITLAAIMALVAWDSYFQLCGTVGAIAVILIGLFFITGNKFQKKGGNTFQRIAMTVLTIAIVMALIMAIAGNLTGRI